MSTNRSIIKLTAIILGTVVLVSSTAVAQGQGRAPRTVRLNRPASAAAPRISRAPARATAPRLQRSPSNGRSLAPRSGGSHSARPSYSLGDLLGGLNSSSRNRGWDGYDPRDGYYGRHDDSERAAADAYRDVGIANALVNLVGILAEAQINNRNAQVNNYQSAPPSGHYERRQVLIKEGYYEEYRVWVPEYQVEQTREVVAGHYETHRRWVPPVYGYQDVWVP